MANSDNIKNDAALVDVSQIKAINKVSFKQRMKSYKRKPLSLVLLILVGLAAALSAAALIFIIAYVLVRGVPNLTPELFSLEYNSDNVSCMPSIINTIVLTLVTLIISVPFGVGAAIYLAEYAKRGNKLVKVIRTMAETLAGIPSIVYGLFGMLFFVYALNWGYSLLAGAFTLAIMILPTVINMSASAIRAVPMNLRATSLALGATKIQTIFKVVVPAAKSGIITGIVLGIGRALGEAMAINLVAGGSVNLPLPFNSVRFLTTQIVSEMSYADGVHRQVLFTVGLVLYIFIMIINLIITFMQKKGEKANG